MRTCGWCSADISHMRGQAKYCSRQHKTLAGVKRHQERKAGSSAQYWREYRAAQKPEGWTDPRRRPVGETSRCSRCREEKPLSAFAWNRQRNRPQNTCKACHAELRRIDTRKRRGLPADALLTTAPDAKPEGHTYRHRGYVLVKKPGHPRATKDGYVYEHIVVAEQKYGMAITQDFTVHHRNADRADNRPENLDLRVGAHGVGGDVIDVLLRLPEVRAEAARTLQGYGWTVAPPQ